MEAGSLVSLAICMAFAAVFVLGARFMILESMSKVYCNCGHEFNEHNIVPKGYSPGPQHSDGTCKKCSCKEFKKNPKDKRNSPPVKFFP